jgi:transcriptional regulator with PAS, ATPase and Fis domain
MIDKVAQTEARVLITNGTELVAHQLHERSERANFLIEVNCAAIPSELIESNCLVTLKGHLPR